MAMKLGRMLAREQRAFLHRDRRGWGGHLNRARAFFQEGLRQADPGRPVLILGAGTGLEIPWLWAPTSTVGWDADPWSRLGTLLRHRRFPPWIFSDFTDGFGELQDTIRRSLHLPGVGQPRAVDRAVLRLAGLLPSLQPRAHPLRSWIQTHRPGTILVANVLGQIGCLAESLVEVAFRPSVPWTQDPDHPDPLVKALDEWTVRVLSALLEVLRDSHARIWTLHDRAVIHGEAPLDLGPLEESWTNQLRGGISLEVGDPLLGLEIRNPFAHHREAFFDRWLWPVGPGQTHLMEALAYVP